MAAERVLVTGANGELGRALIERLAADEGYEVVTVDLVALPDTLRSGLAESYTGDAGDRKLLDRVAADHPIDVIYHLAAVLSSRGEREPELAHEVNVGGTLNVLRMAHNHSALRGRAVKVIFPSSIAVYGFSSVAEKTAIGPVREEEYNQPITMYGCSKLYCEHLGRYFSAHVRQYEGVVSGPARIDFRALRFPGLISAETVPTGGTSDFGPEMIHAAAAGIPYTCFVDPLARIPFMAMPDAVRALVDIARADRACLSTCVYNVGSISLTAAQIADRVGSSFRGSKIDFAPDPARARIIDSWPEDVDDTRARADWGWRPVYDWERTMGEYVVPKIRARYAQP